ncbi:hypothetical protein F4860DRAFT_279727 [Xylaria cubensis]|nr:hypothetical protein F4860DRAFT_279727 [Xylaria cubensis]
MYAKAGTSHLARVRWLGLVFSPPKISTSTCVRPWLENKKCHSVLILVGLRLNLLFLSCVILLVVPAPVPVSLPVPVSVHLFLSYPVFPPTSIHYHYTTPTTNHTLPLALAHGCLSTNLTWSLATFQSFKKRVSLSARSPYFRTRLIWSVAFSLT